LAGALKSLYGIIDQICIRSFASLLVHVCVAAALGAVFYFGQFVAETISDNNLVTVLAAIAAASGAFLALSLALGTFTSQYHTDWTYRNYERLRNQREKIENVMRKSAGKYPKISHYLSDRYMYMYSYIPGKPVELDEIFKADVEFRDWVTKCVDKSGKKIDFGNINDYETFAKHAMDAIFVAGEAREIIVEISMAELHGRGLGSFPPLITTWALIMVFSLVFAITGSLNITSDSINLSVLIMPVYLCFFAVSAIVIDFRALIKRMRIREIGWEMSEKGLTKQNGVGKNE
jgi:hypothetical protein